MNPESIIAKLYKPSDFLPLLTVREEQELAREIKDGESLHEKDKAIKRLVLSNLKLVMKIASSYTSCIDGNGGVGVEDLINEGNIGLMIAAKRFHPDKSKFSTYASFWIRQSIIKTLCDKSRLIRLPTNLVQQSLQVHKFMNKYKDEHGEEPSALEISEALDVRLALVKKILNCDYRYIPLESPTGQSDNYAGERKVADIIRDALADSPYLIALTKDDKATIDDALSLLTSKERYVIERRYGLNNNDVETLEQIGEAFGLTRERIRQIEFDTMKKLRRTLTKQYR